MGLKETQKRRPGCLALRKSRSTGTVVGLYQASKTSSLADPDCGDWVTVCEDHAGLVYHDTRSNAEGWLSHPEEWCPVCQGEEDPPEGEDINVKYKRAVRKGAPDFYLKRDPKTDAEWDEIAAFHGVESGAAYKEQIRLADEILLEILKEEG